MITCPRCQGTSTSTVKVKQPSGLMEEVIVESKSMPMYDVQTKMTKDGSDISYNLQMYVCSDCTRFFALVKTMIWNINGKQITLDGNAIPETKTLV